MKLGVGIGVRPGKRSVIRSRVIGGGPEAGMVGGGKPKTVGIRARKSIVYGRSWVGIR